MIVHRFIMSDLSPDEQPLWQEYEGVVWVGDKSGVRVEILATSAGAAKDLVKQTYGEDCFVVMKNIYAAKRSRFMELRRLREYHLDRLNQAFWHSSMYGGEVALRIYMDNVAFQEGLEEVWAREQENLVVRGASTSTGVAGAFARVIPVCKDDAAVASVFADIAWHYDWLAVDRSVSDEAYDQLVPVATIDFLRP